MSFTPLGALDALFLHLETPATPMHVGSLHLLDAPVDSADLFSAIVRHVTARLSSLPVFTRSLRPLPLSFANPAWTDAGDIDLVYHVERVRLPSPGTKKQLEAAVARLHGQLLDRRRPLWRMFVIEGLADGGCALYWKIHHAAVDGAAGVALTQALLDPSPVAVLPAHAPARSSPRALPGDRDEAQLLGAVLVHNGRAGIALARRLPALARSAVGLLRGGGADELLAWARHVDLAPPTTFNRSIDGARSIATFSAPLAQVRSIADAHGATVNDVVLAIVGGGLRHHLGERGRLPSESLLAAMPVSLRASGDTRMNTQASMAQANLGTDIDDPIERLRAIHAAAAAAKSMTRAMRPVFDVSLPSIGLPWLLTGAAALYGTAGVAERLPRLANVVVSNVPGPPQPLYLAGARLRSYWPLSIVEHGLGLNVTVVRYVDSLDFGLVAARVVLADPARLAQAMLAALAELTAATPGAPPQLRRIRSGRARPAAAPSASADSVNAGRSPAERAPRGARRRAA